ncbi:UrcA family protein [uncultured Erythrobacter sp.]|uniref:UrcA family protein n=1 Tax=uncultured Erythrobacter sp. TaxID=263913 RepID=UPI002605A763|nr:UrcA family protein [uncultured Erythrobacter sp.]
MKTIVLAAAALGLVATPAFAGPAKGESTSVSFAGLDLETAEGQKILQARIDSAARSVCQVDRIRTGTRLKSSEARDCYAKARASAKRQVATAIADQQFGG